MGFAPSAPALLLLGAALANLVLGDAPRDAAEPFEQAADDASILAHDVSHFLGLPTHVKVSAMVSLTVVEHLPE